jgi:hypothetical protein
MQYSKNAEISSRYLTTIPSRRERPSLLKPRNANNGRSYNRRSVCIYRQDTVSYDA